MIAGSSRAGCVVVAGSVMFSSMHTCWLSAQTIWSCTDIAICRRTIQMPLPVRALAASGAK